MSLISLLLTLLLIGVIFWAARAILAAFGVGDPIRTVVYVLLTIVCLIWVFQAFGVSLPGFGRGLSLR